MKSNSPIQSHKLTWLLSPDRDFAILESHSPDVERLPYAIPPEVGKAWVDILSLPDGIVLYQAVHALEPSPAGQLVPLLEVENISEEFVFNAQIFLTGLGCHHEYWRGRNFPPVEIIASPGRDTFRFKKEWQAQVLVEGGATSEMRSVTVPDSLLRTLLGEDAAEDLLGRLGLSTQRPTVVHPMPLHVSAPLRDAMSSKFSGPVRKLYAQARVLDYLVGLLDYLYPKNLVSPKHTADKIIVKLHHHLINLEGRLPTLVDLTKEFGVSARRLNANFAAKYGQTIYGFITDHRLAQAHAILLSEPIPLKTLAVRLGYSHVNHFSAAFRNKFGYPPGSLKRK
ncbi:MAG: helix-turn-helix domain-containing protein [Candidatus Methylumidiphilus sp.]